MSAAEHKRHQQQALGRLRNGWGLPFDIRLGKTKEQDGSQELAAFQPTVCPTEIWAGVLPSALLYALIHPDTKALADQVAELQRRMQGQDQTG